MIDRKRVASRINQWVLIGNKNQSCRVIGLWHQEGDGRAKPVATWEVDEKTDPAKLTDEILSTAGEDADQIGDSQVYFICAYFGEENVGSTSYGARIPLRIDAAPSMNADPESGISSSANRGTAKGVADLATRFADDVMRQVIPWVNATMRTQQDMIHRLEAQNNELMNDKYRTLKLTERLLNESHKRQLMTRKQIVWERQREEAAAMLFPLVPPLLLGLAGKGGEPAMAAAKNPSSPVTRTFRDFINMLRIPEQLMSLQQVLSANQLPAVMSMYQDIQKGKEPNHVTLREFAKSIDDNQLAAFEDVLDEDQFKVFIEVISSLVSEDDDKNEAARAAYEEAEAAIDPDEEETLEEDAGLKASTKTRAPKKKSDR